MEGADMATDVDSIIQQKPHLGVKIEASRMWKAYQLVKDGKRSIRYAARINGVAEATLRTRLKNPRLFESNLGHPLLLGKDEENQIAEQLRKLTSLGQGYSRSKALEVAAKVAKVSGIEKFPKKDWYYGFLKRYPDLATNRIKKNLPTTTKNKNIKKYFKEFEAFLDKHDLKDKAEKIWNVELIGLALNKSCVEANGSITTCIDRGVSEVTASILLAANAAGEILPPYVVYKGKRLTKDLTTGCITQSQFAVSASGLPTSRTMDNFLEKLFIPHVDVRPIVILYDSNADIIGSRMIEKAKEKGIHFFVLPTHLSAQPTVADSGIFRHFKVSLMANCKKLFEEDVHLPRSKIPHMIAEAFEATMTVENLCSAFRMSGLVPFNPLAALHRENTKLKNADKGRRHLDRKRREKLKKNFLKITLKNPKLKMKMRGDTDEVTVKKRKKDSVGQSLCEALTNVVREDSEVNDKSEEERQESEVKDGNSEIQTSGDIHSEEIDSEVIGTKQLENNPEVEREEVIMLRF